MTDEELKKLEVKIDADSADSLKLMKWRRRKSQRRVWKLVESVKVRKEKWVRRGEIMN
jgi:hypothetical protein